MTSRTIFASRKLSIRDYLMAVAIFSNGAKGHPALQLSRELECQYKTAFVLAHKIREVVGAGYGDLTARGEVEVDGAYFGGYVKPANRADDRVDLRRTENQSGKRRSVVIMRERGGRTLPFVFPAESHAVPTLLNRITKGTVVHADEASHWDQLNAKFVTKRINHSKEYSDGEACTNQAESFFSRMRRAEIGIHHSIADHTLAYAREMAWREDNRRLSNGALYLLAIRGAMTHPKSEQWCGYWQRRKKGVQHV